MANSLEKFFLAKVKMMPPVEVDLTQQMMTKKNDPPKKVLPPGSSHNSLTNSTNKMLDSKTTPSKSAQLGLPHESFAQSAGSCTIFKTFSDTSFVLMTYRYEFY